MQVTTQIVSPDKLKDVLITRTAIKTLQQEDIIEKVVSHEFKSAKDALKIYREVEISGFGKFIIYPKKLTKKINKKLEIKARIDWQLANGDLSVEKREDYLIKSEAIEEEITYLKTKIEDNEN